MPSLPGDQFEEGREAWGPCLFFNKSEVYIYIYIKQHIDAKCCNTYIDLF